MIAQLIVATPFPLIVPDATTFTGYSYEEGEYIITARPPLLTDGPLPRDLPTNVEIDGKPAFVANALQFEFRKTTPFARARDSEYDPPLDLLQRVVTGFLARLRFAARAPQIEPLSLKYGATWRLEYLNDDGAELPEDPDLIRARMGRHWKWSSVTVTPAVWEQIHELEPDWASPVWDDILLDAFHALPRIGTAVVLAATALEVFISTILDRIAGSARKLVMRAEADGDSVRACCRRGGSNGRRLTVPCSRRAPVRSGCRLAGRDHRRRDRAARGGAMPTLPRALAPDS